MSTREQEDEALKKLEEIVKGLEARKNWSHEDVQVIDRMIVAYRGLMTLGFLFGAAKQALIWIAAFSAAVVAVRAGLLEWLGIGGGLPKP